MDSTTSVVCSICCEVFCMPERNSVNSDLLELLTFLVTTNTNSLQNIFVCETCSKKIQDAYNFKKSFVENFHRVVTELQEKVDLKMFCICWVCKEVIKKSSSISWSHFIKEFKEINCLTEESNLQLYDSHICAACQELALNFLSVINSLSIYDENRTHRYSVKSGLLNNEPKETECSNVTEENSTTNKQDVNTTIKVEIDSDNEELRYEDFIHKNKTFHPTIECRESDFSERMWTNSEDGTINSLNLALHFEVNYGNIEMFTCPVCNFKTKRKGNLQKHMLVHKNINEIEMFKCDVCEFKTKHKHIIKSHTLVHKNIDDLEVFKCDLCEYKTRIKGNFKRHIITHKSIDETELFTCEICDYKTKTKGHLKQHLLIHKSFDEIEPFTCSICNFKAKRKGNLKKHMICHKNVAEIQMFTCDLCEFKTKYKHILKSHTLVHKNIDDIEVFKCNVCGYKGKRKDTLKRHMLTHKNSQEIE